MKNIFIVFMIILGSGVLYAQNHLLPFKDDKINFYDVITIEGMSKDELLINAKKFVLGNEKKKNKKTEENEEFSYFLFKKGSFYVYKRSFVKSIHGSISYSLTIEVKNNKYRYSYTDFIFNYYKRDRYGKFVKDKGRYRHLEDPYMKGMQNVWDNHKLKVKEIIEGEIARLSIAIAYKKEEQKEIVSKKEKEWVEWE